MTRFRPLALAALLALIVLVLAACGSDDSSDTSTSAATSGATSAAAATATTAADPCATDQLALVSDGKLTVATDKPAYPPYFEDDDPTNGKGFESAVAYAIADQLGFSKRPGRLDGRAVQLLLRARAEGLRLRRQPDLDHADARQGGRLLGAVLHGARRRSSRSRRLRRGQRDLARRPEGRQDRRPDRHDQPRRRRRGDQADRSSRRSSTTPTTSSPALKNDQVDAVVVDLPTALLPDRGPGPGRRRSSASSTRPAATAGAPLLDKDSELTPCVSTRRSRS